MGRDADLEAGVFAGIAAFHDLADGMNPGDYGGFFLGDHEVEEFAGGPQLGANFRQQGFDAFAGNGRDANGVGIFFAQHGGNRARQPVNLVENHQRRLAFGGNFLEHSVDGRDLFFGLGVADIDNVQEQIRLDDLFERGFERFHQAVGQFFDEAHRIGQQNVLVGGQFQAAGGRIQRGEQFVLGQNGGAGELIQERGFAGIGIADDGSQRPVATLTAHALRLTLTADAIEVTCYAIDAFLGFAAVGFQLGFTFTTAHTDTAGLAGQVRPKPGEAREQMLELRQLNLQFAFAGAGALGKNIENQRRAVEYLALEHLFQIAALGRRKLIVENDRINEVFLAKSGKFLRFALADVRGGDGGGHFLGAIANDFGASGFRKFGEFGEGFSHFGGLARFEFDANQKRSFGAGITGLDERFQLSNIGTESILCGMA